MKLYNGDERRTCLLCGDSYTAKHLNEGNSFCNSCFTPDRKREFYRVDTQVKRAKALGLEATLTIKQWLLILDRFNSNCAYCQCEATGKVSVFQLLEHILAVRDGGGTTALNCVPACVSCNRRKDRPKDGMLLPEYKIIWVKQELECIIGKEPE